jgi:DNA-binding response OmpR family regulator
MRRMLIVEDERDICDCLAQFFTARGFSVISAFSGEEALEQLKAHPADVILLDILLPGLSGIEVLKRAKELHPRARVVMVTALDQQDLRFQANHYGAAAYVTKPFDFSNTTWSAVFAPT